MPKESAHDRLVREHEERKKMLFEHGALLQMADDEGDDDYFHELAGITEDLKVRFGHDFVHRCVVAGRMVELGVTAEDFR